MTISPDYSRCEKFVIDGKYEPDLESANRFCKSCPDLVFNPKQLSKPEYLDRVLKCMNASAEASNKTLQKTSSIAENLQIKPHG